MSDERYEDHRAVAEWDDPLMTPADAGVAAAESGDQ